MLGMNKENNAKVIYFTDAFDNTKETLCVLMGDCDMRNERIISRISAEIKEVFSFNSEISIHSKDVANAIAHFGFAEVGGYSFGVDDVPFVE